MKKVVYFLVFAALISVNVNSQNYNQGKYLRTGYTEKFRENYGLKQDFNQRWDSPDNKLMANWDLHLMYLADIVQAVYYDGVDVSRVSGYAKEMIEYCTTTYRPFCTPKRQKEFENQAKRVTMFVVEFSKTKRL